MAPDYRYELYRISEFLKEMVDIPLQQKQQIAELEKVCFADQSAPYDPVPMMELAEILHGILAELPHDELAPMDSVKVTLFKRTAKTTCEVMGKLLDNNNARG